MTIFLIRHLGNAFSFPPFVWSYQYELMDFYFVNVNILLMFYFYFVNVHVKLLPFTYFDI